MNNPKKILLFLSAFLFLISCHKNNDAPSPPPFTTLAITSISPTTGGKNSVLTIKGTYFSTLTAENEVYITPAILGPYTVSTPVGTDAPNNATGFLDGAGTNARFNFPTGVAIDTIGNLYVADKLNNTIRKIELQNASVYTWNGSNAPGLVDGPAPIALFNFPTGLAADPGGNYLLTTDTHNNNIRELANLVSGSPFVATEAGSTAGAAGFLDGDYSNARFWGPTSIAIDVARADNVIADYDNNSIRIMDFNTLKVRTLAGSPNHPGSDDGPLATATFNSPLGVAVDAAGNIYVADSQNHRIRKIAYE